MFQSVEEAGTEKLRTGSCTACMNANILGSCALLSFFKPSIQLQPWNFPPKHYKLPMMVIEIEEFHITRTDLWEIILHRYSNMQQSVQYFHRHIFFSGKTKPFFGMFYTNAPHKTE